MPGDRAIHSSRPDRRFYRVRDRVVHRLLPLLMVVVRRLPRSLFDPLAHVLGAIYLAIPTRERRIQRDNLERVLGLEPGSRENRRMMRAVVFHEIVTMLETVRGIVDPDAIRLDGYERLHEVAQRLLASGRGFLLVTGHLGSWELVAQATARATDDRFHLLAKKSRIGPVTELLGRLRRDAGSKVLWNDSKALVREMLRVLADGQALGFAMDQKPANYLGPAVDFFGYATEFVPGPAALAERTGAGVIAVFAVRVGRFHYRLLCDQLLEPGHGRRGENALTQLMAGAIERRIREYPEQWTWSYRRWLFEGRKVYRPRRRKKRSLAAGA